jgi:pimeloyl-ACP methyl ester carboxylesterase
MWVLPSSSRLRRLTSGLPGASSQALSKGNNMNAHFSVTTSTAGVVELEFAVGEVPGLLWSPSSTAERAPLVLMAHSGGLSKRSPGITSRARHYVTEYGFHVAAIDAPGHGDRPRNRQDQQWVAALMRAREDGDPIGSIIAEYNGSLAERAVPEWQATLTALQALPEIGSDAPVGFGGMTLGTATGLMLMAAEPRVAAASLGGVFVYDALLEAAMKVTAPIELLLPWDDEEITRRPGFELFDRIGSASKMLHAHPGRHNQVPGSEVDSSARFFVRHLVDGDSRAA